MSPPTYLPYVQGLREDNWVSVALGTSPPLAAYPKVRARLGGRFGLRLPSDPSLAR